MNEAMIKFCRDAVQVQDACNPVAIVNCLAGHLNKWKELGYNGWDDLRKDAPFILFINKLESMCGAYSINAFGGAMDTCERIAGITCLETSCAQKPISGS